jgi:orotidine 5'-phosphate decarboxylase subfamily 2
MNRQLCVGLDQPNAIRNVEIIQATCEFANCYKINFAAYEAQGIAGLKELSTTLNFIQKVGLPAIADTKRVDIGPEYAQMVFDWWGFDACTVHPYMGFEAIQPFLEYENKSVFVLCRTSNKPKFQLAVDADSLDPLFIEVAKEASSLKRSDIGLVMGATDIDAIEEVRQFFKGQLLIPGIGPQGGDLEKVILAAEDNFIISVSRLIYELDNPREVAESIFEVLHK